MNSLSDKLSDLFGKAFTIGFLVPAIVFLAGFYLLFASSGMLPEWIKFGNVREFLDATAATVLFMLLSWLIALVLLAINRPLVRAAEGYPYNFGWFSQRAKRRFEAKALPMLSIQREIDEARGKAASEPTRPPGFASKLRSAVDSFPDSVEHVLPTSFGNRYRSIEVYSRVVYGLDAVPAWGRLAGLLPESLRATLAEAKAQVDFSLNISIAGVILVIIYGILAMQAPILPSIWILALSIVVSLLGYLSAVSALSEYGLYIKSAFDLHRSELAESLGLELPNSPADEREMWRDVSRMMIFHSAAALDGLEKYRRKAPKTPRATYQAGRNFCGHTAVGATRRKLTK